MEEKIFTYIKEQIELKKAQNRRPLLVTHRNISDNFNKNCKEELKNLVITGKLHWGHTLNDKWFSIYDKNNLL